MVPGITEDNKIMKNNLDGEAMETEKIEEEAVNGEKRLCANQLEEKLIDEQSQEPVRKVEDILMQVDEIQQNKFLQIFNEDQKKLDKSENNMSNVFDFNLQFKLNLPKDTLYEEKGSTIQNQVDRKYGNVLYIDNRCSKTKPDFIDTTLSEVDKKVQIRHQWKRNVNTWEGAVAVFETLDNAIEAQRRLSYSRYLTAENMPAILKMLREAEVLYPKSEDPGTIVIIRRIKPMPHCLKRWIVAELKQFGEVLYIEFEPHTKPGEVCRAWYRFSSHAILAKLILDQSTVRKIGKVSAEIIMTKKAKHILGYMKNYL